jgi:hypothetical protein
MRFLLLLLLFQINSIHGQTKRQTESLSFFGSNCVVDTLTLVFSKKEVLFINRTRGKIQRLKKGKSVWTVEFNEMLDSDQACFRAYFINNKFNKGIIFLDIWINNRLDCKICFDYKKGTIISHLKVETQSEQF